jgi:hypothetical protein
MCTSAFLKPPSIAMSFSYYLPALQSKGIKRCGLILNASPSAVTELSRLLKLPQQLQLFSDENGF